MNDWFDAILSNDVISDDVILNDAIIIITNFGVFNGCIRDTFEGTFSKI